MQDEINRLNSIYNIDKNSFSNEKLEEYKKIIQAQADKFEGNKEMNIPRDKTEDGRFSFPYIAPIRITHCRNSSGPYTGSQDIGNLIRFRNERNIIISQRGYWSHNAFMAGGFGCWFPAGVDSTVKVQTLFHLSGSSRLTSFSVFPPGSNSHIDINIGITVQELTSGGH